MTLAALISVVGPHVADAKFRLGDDGTETASLRSTARLQLAETAKPDPARPNIVFLLADDLGYGDLGCYGGPARTPNIDRLTREGVRFTQFCANGAECSPTRTAFITGRYQHRVVKNRLQKWEAEVRPRR
jgi:hypothetical protein